MFIPQIAFWMQLTIGNGDRMYMAKKVYAHKVHQSSQEKHIPILLGLRKQRRVKGLESKIYKDFYFNLFPVPLSQQALKHI
jgi:hypothetical protein